MTPLILAALFGGLALFLMIDDDSDDTEEQTELTITEEGDYVTTDGDDLVMIDGSFEAGDLSLQTLDGDDTVVSPTGFSGADINTGAGNDSIDLSFADLSTIEGGSGDDFIRAVGGEEPNELYGGDGNDTVSGDTNARLYGGAGDDVVEILGPGTDGAGYNVLAFGGDGDDTLIMNNPLEDSFHLDQGIGNNGAVATGGAGSDVFEVVATVEETFQETLDEYLSAETPAFMVEDNAVQFLGFTIEDFEPGVDQIEVNATSELENSVLTTAILDAPTSEYELDYIRGHDTILTLVYETPDDAALEIKVAITSSSTVTFDDIVFTGDQPVDNLIEYGTPVQA